MSKLYKAYKWKNGIPYGIQPFEGQPEGPSYKVISDPYFKRISIEQYDNEHFTKIIYDSALFDFRHLRATEQIAWEKREISPTVTEIRNQDDRLILVENYTFEENRCRLCEIRSPLGVLLAKQQMLYTALNDPFNGVVLFDINGQPVIQKTYELDETTGEFTRLLAESWDIALFNYSAVLREVKVVL